VILTKTRLVRNATGLRRQPPTHELLVTSKSRDKLIGDRGDSILVAQPLIERCRRLGSSAGSACRQYQAKQNRPFKIVTRILLIIAILSS
jgi:hypothetical protein